MGHLPANNPHLPAIIARLLNLDASVKRGKITDDLGCWQEDGHETPSCHYCKTLKYLHATEKLRKKSKEGTNIRTERSD